MRTIILITVFITFTTAAHWLIKNNKPAAASVNEPTRTEFFADNIFLPAKKGMVLTTVDLNDKGYPVGYTRLTVKDVSGSDSGMSITYAALPLDAKRRPKVKGGGSVFTAKVTNGIMELEIKDFVNPTAETADIPYGVTGGKIRLPAELRPGGRLEDIRVKMFENLRPAADTFFVDVLVEQKCEAIEKVTVPAGTFECYKVTHKTTSTTNDRGVNEVRVTNSSTWYARGIGRVKFVSYGARGEVQSSVELLEIGDIAKMQIDSSESASAAKAKASAIDRGYPMGTPVEIMDFLDDYVKDSTVNYLGGALAARNSGRLGDSVKIKDLKVERILQMYRLKDVSLNDYPDTVSFSEIIQPVGYWYVLITAHNKPLYQLVLDNTKERPEFIMSSSGYNKELWEPLLKYYPKQTEINPIFFARVNFLSSFREGFLYFEQKGPRKVHYLKPGFVNDTLSVLFPNPITALDDSKKLIRYWKDKGLN